MGLFLVFKRPVDPAQEIKNSGFEISECSLECENCTASYPKSLLFEEETPLWGSTKPYGLQVVVSTNKTDWSHDALETSDLTKAVNKWSSSAHFDGLGNSATIKVNTSSLGSTKFESDEEYISGTRGDLLLLPFFVWVRNVSYKDAGAVLDRLVVDLVKYRDAREESLPIASYPEFPGVTFEADRNKAFVFLCSHKTRDKRCGITAPIIKREMEMHLRDLGLYRDFSDDRPGGVEVAYINHIGGHKFAANVIIYLKNSGKNIWLARCKPNNVIPIVDECIVHDGKVWPEAVRQVQKYKPVEW